MTTQSDAYAVRELTASELDHVSGASPVLAGAALAVAGYIIGKNIDDIVDATGIMDKVVEVKNGKISVGGKPLN